MSKLSDLWRYNDRAIGLIRVIRKVLLVVIFGRPEMLKSGDFRYDRLVVKMFGHYLDNYLLGGPFLLIIMVEDHRAIRWADIVALPVLRRGVVYGKEDAEQVAIRENLGIEA